MRLSLICRRRYRLRTSYPPMAARVCQIICTSALPGIANLVDDTPKRCCRCSARSRSSQTDRWPTHAIYPLSRNSAVEPQMETKEHEWKAAGKCAAADGIGFSVSFDDRALSSHPERSTNHEWTRKNTNRNPLENTPSVMSPKGDGAETSDTCFQLSTLSFGLLTP